MRTCSVLAAGLLAGGLIAAGHAAEYGPIAYWSADDLKAGQAVGLPLETATHRFDLLRLDANAARPAESHEGTTDIFFVLSGSATILAGGEIVGAGSRPATPGEFRGTAIRGAGAYVLESGAAISLPPSTAFQIRPGPAGITAVRLKVNVGMHPWTVVSTQQTTLAATPAHPTHGLPTSRDQGGIVYWPAATLRAAHETMAAAARRGQPMNDPRDLVPIPATPTHAWNFLNRNMGANGQPPGVEFHEANTDIYFVVAGTGTLMTAGEVVDKEPIAGRPGEYRGPSIRGGRGYRVKAGDVINMPPSTPHQSLPDPGGFSYLLVKVNTGRYPWAMVDPN